MKRVGVVTGLALPEPDHDEPLLVAALARAGASPSVVAWDDPGVAWGALDLCVVRSTWNYIDRRAAFCAWAEACARETRLFNPPDVLAWSTDKRYLGELEARGVPIVPTAFAGASDTASSLADARGWGAIVIKPRVSAGSHATRRFGAGERAAADAFLAERAAAGDAMMVQPYQRAVEEGGGERSLVWVDGAWTHAVRKSPRFSGDAESVTGPLPIAGDERAVAERALAPLADRVLYARCDLVRGDDGAPRVMELELAEPSLFLDRSPEALDRLVRGLLARA